MKKNTNFYYSLFLILLGFSASAQTPPIFPNPDFDVLHDAVISGTVTTDEGARPLPGIVARLSRVGSPNVPVSFALTDPNGNYSLSGKSGVEYIVEFVYPSSGFSAASGNPSDPFTAVEGQQGTAYNLELTRAANTITNCGVTPNRRTSWEEQLSLPKPTPLQPAAQLTKVEVFTSSSVHHPTVDIISTTPTTVQRLEIGAALLVEGPAAFENESQTYKLFASSPASRNITMGAEERLTYYNISSANTSNTVLESIPAAYLGAGTLDFNLFADAHALQGTTGGNVATLVETNATAGVCVTYTYDSDPLPVKLISFSAKTGTEDNVTLRWSTSEEVDALQFEIQHSTDSRKWETLGTENAANASYSNYQFRHHNPVDGVNYYRLKNIDIDGSFEFSHIVSVRVNREISGGKIYPNPAPANTDLYFDLPGIEIAEVGIYDLSGRWVNSQKLSQTANTIRTNNLNEGLYILKITDTNGKSIRKTLVIR